MHTAPNQTLHCTHCPRTLTPGEHGRYACHRCEDHARTHLANLPHLYTQLGDALHPTRTLSNTGRVTASKTAPLGAALEPLSLRGPGGITDLILGIEHRWRTHLEWAPLPHRGNYETSLAGSIPILLNTLGWACSNYPQIADDLKLVDHLHHQADTAVNGTSSPRVPIGHCPTEGQGGAVCGERLKVSPWAHEIHCQACDTRWPRTEWLKLGQTLRDTETARLRRIA